MLAYALPLAYSLVAYGLVWACDLGTFADDASVDAIARSLGWASVSRPVIVIGYVVLMAVLGLVSALATGLGEEIGWRGFLAPRLVARTGFTIGSLVKRFIMMIWHLPVIMWLRLRSKSISIGTAFP